ncbi:16S rRNA (guanine(966)-N(2))-methyltransferase RsmD [Chromatium okenii]|uniref:16S rRNA (guanine(966)-N(2))-methyltransferase RsmD n=1 Tax=Chromatium okenii TaxID=61644 RepID=UPI0019075448|nr:16S rRNA (guanine(966)-N(2))-methyltransferase RsmD [Chromatium okenii]MBK1642571.1 16S rRNA (guanine(966)-N(2))-methyltransferase RsmD [Chromatium okenii]
MIKIKHPVSQVRIIGGQWRGRRLPIVAQPGLRPTPDRVRETLFNWLAPTITGARCLDLFAGSGALGFEAASRGASEVVLIERAPLVARQLQRNAQLLNWNSGLEIVTADALTWLAGAGRPFEVIFLDPPYADAALAPTLARLVKHGWVATGARVYLETSAAQEFPPLPPGWELIRQKTAGLVRYGLATV